MLFLSPQLEKQVCLTIKNTNTTHSTALRECANRYHRYVGLFATK